MQLYDFFENPVRILYMYLIEHSRTHMMHGSAGFDLHGPASDNLKASSRAQMSEALRSFFVVMLDATNHAYIFDLVFKLQLRLDMF